MPNLSELPDPAVEPTISVPRAGRIVGIGRAAAYQAAQDGTLPTLKFGHRIVVPTAQLLRLLGIVDQVKRASTDDLIRASERSSAGRSRWHAGVRQSADEVEPELAR